MVFKTRTQLGLPVAQCKAKHTPPSMAKLSSSKRARTVPTTHPHTPSSAAAAALQVPQDAQEAPEKNKFQKLDAQLPDEQPVDAPEAEAQVAEPLEFDAAANERAQMIALANNAISKVAANNTAIGEQIERDVINAHKLQGAAHEVTEKAMSATTAQGGKDLIKLFNSHADFQMKFFAMVQKGEPNA